MAGTTWQAAWQQLVQDVADGSGGEWTRAGKRGTARLVFGRVGWWLSSVAFGHRSGGEGWLFAAHQALVEPWAPVITLRQDEYTGDDLPSGGYAPLSDVAADQLAIWIAGPARAHFIDEGAWDWVEAHTIMWEQAPEEVPRTWPALAGLRVIADAGPALPVIDDTLALESGDDPWPEQERSWWEQFRDVAASESRSDQLRWLDARRRETLAALGVPESIIIDVLAEDGG
ncbi:hypothetical protein [uncultured Jatrophihabitans sp.]|uniref:hypothetical protein n=1 Tax=uncultured Jatrophihabitans sp. TaxID=1610747 RepID=UPI0035CB7CAB